LRIYRTHQECILYLLYCGMLGCEGYIYPIRLEREKISIQRLPSFKLPARFASLVTSVHASSDQTAYTTVATLDLAASQSTARSHLVSGRSQPILLSVTVSSSMSAPTGSVSSSYSSLSPLCCLLVAANGEFERGLSDTGFEGIQTCAS
jgi:hypothetical protein